MQKVRVHGGLARSPLVSRKEGRQYSLLPVIHRTHTCTTRLFSHRPAFRLPVKDTRERTVAWACPPPPPFLGEDSPAILGVLGGEWWWWRPSGELAASPPPPLPVRRAQGKALRGKGDLTRRKGIRGIRSKLAGDSLCPQDSSQKYLLRTYYTTC